MKKVILVTGANKGIGYGIVEQYALHKNLLGNEIIMTSRDKDRGNEAYHKLTYTYPEIKNHLHFHQLDIRDNHSIKKMKHYLEDKFGQLDVIYNNAGVLYRHIPKDREERRKELIQTFETNVWGPINLTEFLISLFLVQNRGHIVNMSSELGKINLSSSTIEQRLLDEHMTLEKLRKLYVEYEHAFIEQTVDFEKAWNDNLRSYGCYPVSKMFFNMYTLILHRRFMRHHPEYNIKVNSCTPGWTKTDMGGESAPRSYLKGAETPYWIGNFTDEKNDELSGRFWKDKTEISFEGIVKDERKNK
jgi:NAD(P)-dependent dehydrogenase (short-subunit alcohol dehydrogenase family)